MLKRYRNGVVPAQSNELSPDAEKGRSPKRAHCLNKAICKVRSKKIWSLVTRANQYVDKTARSNWRRTPAQAQRLDEVLYNLAETCRVLAVLLWPFLPGTAAKIYAQLGLKDEPK